MKIFFLYSAPILFLLTMLTACNEPAQRSDEKRGLILIPGDIRDVGVDNWIRIIIRNTVMIIP